jgi:hypothetical protein
MCLADQKIWEASKHLLECKVYSQKFWDVKIWDNRPLVDYRQLRSTGVPVFLDFAWGRDCLYTVQKG